MNKRHPMLSNTIQWKNRHASTQINPKSVKKNNQMRS